jgi:hypothetical protein
LNSHPRLNGFPGEANRLWHPKSYPFSNKTTHTAPIVENPKRFTEVSIKSWPNHHERIIRRRLVGYHLGIGLRSTLFVKSAMISFMIPKLISMFPDAKFLHIYRNGPSVVESFLKKEWPKYRNYFASEQEYRVYCSKYWCACLLEIEKRKNELSLDSKRSFLEFSYEKLCANPSETLSNIAKFLSVDSKRFNFDASQIVSKNDKVGDFLSDRKWIELLKLMSPAMKLKGYI